MKMNMKTAAAFVTVAATSVLLGAAHAATTCVAPENGMGTANIPDMCVYTSQSALFITDGLPVGTSIRIDPPSFTEATNVIRTPDGLGGEDVQFETELVQMTLTGSGLLNGFQRTITLSGGALVHNNPRVTSTSPQVITSELRFLTVQILGDPDFDLLRIAGGTQNGLPGPGTTTLTQSGGGWAVDSFFDITYQIQFVGATGGPLSGLSGSTQGTAQFQAVAPVPLPVPVVLLGSACGLLLPWIRNRRAA